MSKLADYKWQFLSDVDGNSIHYDWDAGWCYSYIKHPIMEEAENELSDEDYELFTQFTDAWLSENDGPYYHMSDVEGNKLINQAEELEGEAAKEYAKGLIDYIQKYGHSPAGPKTTGFYSDKIAELEKFIKEN